MQHQEGLDTDALLQDFREKVKLYMDEHIKRISEALIKCIEFKSKASTARVDE